MANEITPVGPESMMDYGKWEVETAQGERDDLARSTSKFLKLVVGPNRVRFLPPQVGKRSPFVTVFQHFMRLKEQERPFVFNCPRMMAKSPCPACIKSDRLRATGNAKDAAAASDMWPGRRVFANVIARAQESDGPIIFGFGKLIHEALLALRTNEDVGGDFTHPHEGLDIVIERTGTGKIDTKYRVYPVRRSTPLGNMEWISMQADLTLLAYVPTMAEIMESIKKIQEAATLTKEDSKTPRMPDISDDLGNGDPGFDDDQIPF